MTKLTLTKGDITQLKVDVIVNAANSSLLGGGGVDGAIHKAAGPGLLAECKTLGGCPVGEAKITSGYNLLAKFVIHTVGPVWHGGNNNEEQLLKKCYHNCLDIAENLKLHTIAFPNVSTGVYHFPKQKAAEIALEEVKSFIHRAEFIQEVIFVAFDEENYSIYSELLSAK
jgi:O-acetyl-ADP-ribose deacetylase